MNIIILLAILISIYGIKVNIKGYNESYISKKQTTAINGLFVVLVFFRHFSQYIELGRQDLFFQKIDTLLGQLIVVPFLFYSGYGIMFSIMKKGLEYINEFPKKRFQKVWCSFVIAVLLFDLVNLVFDNYKNYDYKTVLLAFTGWTSVGNSNWYVFAVLCLYLFTYIAFKMFSISYIKSVFLIFIMSGFYIILLYQIKESWWYNTIIAYPVGMLYGLLKERVENFIQKDIKKYIITILIIITLELIMFKCSGFIAYELKVILFICIVIMITMKMQIGNKMLSFLGKYTFEIYILQRIPMIVLVEYTDNTYLFFILTFMLTLFMAIMFHKILNLKCFKISSSVKNKTSC